MNVNREERNVRRDFATVIYADFIRNVKIAAQEIGNIFRIDAY